MALKPAAQTVAHVPAPELSPLPGYENIENSAATTPEVSPEKASQTPREASTQSLPEAPAPAAEVMSASSARPALPEADFQLKPAAALQPSTPNPEAGSAQNPANHKDQTQPKKARRGKAQPMALKDGPRKASAEPTLMQPSLQPVAQRSAPEEGTLVSPQIQTQSLGAERAPSAGHSDGHADVHPDTKQSEPMPHAAADSAPPRKPIKISVDLSQAIQDAKNIFKPDAIKPVSYSPMPGIAVFAVVKHGNDRVFGDLPTLFAREYAQRLGVKVPNTKVYNPIYTVDELRMQGLGHVYDQIMAYYIKTGAPEPTAMDYLLKQISANRPSITRVVFVEADVDFTHPDASTNLMDRVKLAMTDDTPKQMKYFVNSRLQIFDAEKPGFPMVWGGSWRRSVKTNQFYNVTSSVYTDTDSQQAFAGVSRQMSQEILFLTPKEVYMIPQYDTAVQGELVNKGLSTGSAPAFPNLPDTQNPANGHLSHENRQAIERILERQNSIAP